MSARISCAALWLIAATAGQPAAAQPTAAQFLADVGFTQEEIAQVEAGSFVPGGTIYPASDREIVAAFAFLVQVPPADLVTQLEKGLVDKADPNTIAFEMIPSPPSLDSFAKLTLEPGAQERAQAYLAAKPGGELNLSNQEIAAFQKLGSGAGTAAVEQAVRSALLARLQAYQAMGLTGTAPYARADGSTRSPGEEIRIATIASRRLQARVPTAHAYFLNYPAGKPQGARESWRWSHYLARGKPTIALTHSLYVPDGNAWLIAQRQFYVSGGYNAEQAIVGFLPMDKGTLVFYTNRTSTDEVAGFGGGTKRSIGSRLLSDQLEALYKKIAAEQKKGGA